MQKLPNPKTKSEVSLEETIDKRISRRKYRKGVLTQSQLSQILWASCKTPSAGATYPLETYVVIGERCVEGIDAGVYYYDEGRGSLEKHLEGDLRDSLANACFHQMFIADAPISIVIAAKYERTTGRYGERGIRYVHIEVGHAGQNIYLQCESLGLGTVAIGAFDDAAVSDVLRLPRESKPLYAMPVGPSEPS